jgi:ABC-type antimicrobial peptide transport system permease subunit
MALGAGAGEVTWMILRQSLGMISIGVIAGMAAALAAGRPLHRLVEGMQPMDAPTLAITVLVLVTAATAAGLAPACRASRINPIRALRQE